MTPTTPPTAAELDEIDHRCAVEIMKFPDKGFAYWRDSEWTRFDKDKNHGFEVIRFRPTRNIAQAWECLQSLRDWHLVLHWNSFNNDKESCAILLPYDGDLDKPLIEISAATAALAIAMACLAAVSPVDEEGK